METNTLISYIFAVSFPTITIIVAMFVLFQNLNKKIDNLSDKLSDRISKLEIKFDLLDERYKSTNQIIEHSNKTTDFRINKIEVEMKEQKAETKSIVEKFIDALPKSVAAM